MTLAEWVECKYGLYIHRTKKNTKESLLKIHLIPDEVAIAALAKY